MGGSEVKIFIVANDQIREDFLNLIFAVSVPGHDECAE